MRNEEFLSPTELRWHAFAKSEELTTEQRMLFERFFSLVKLGNAYVNLTRIVALDKFIALHLQDSLAIGKFVDLNTSEGIVDVGTGAGFPGIPLAIAYPNLPVYLLEVHLNRIYFLQKTLADLNLSNCEIINLDWRTFLRTTAYPIDCLFARASLPPRELIRALKPSCPYNNATLVYWASGGWECPPSIKPYFQKEVQYGINRRTHKFVFLKKLETVSS